MSERRRMLLAIVNQFKWLPYSYTYLYHSLVPQTISGKNVRNKAKFTKIYGNSEVVNQLCPALYDYTHSGGVVFTTSNNGRKATLSGTSSSYWVYDLLFDKEVPIGSKVLVSVKLTNPNNVFTYGYRLRNASDLDYYGDNQLQIFTTTKVIDRIQFYGNPNIDYTGCAFEDVQVVVLTQRYPFDTPTTLTDNRVKNILAQGYIPYNTGEIKDMVIGEFSSNDSNNQPLGTLPLPAPYQASGIGTSKDTWEITNTSHIFTRNNFEVELGGLTWTYESLGSGDNYYSDIISNAVKYSVVLCDKYTCDMSVSPATLRNNVWISQSGRINITADGYSGNVNNFKTAMSGVMLKYQLATPQTITIPRKHLAVVDLGSLDYVAQGNGRFVSSGLTQTIKPVSDNANIGNIYCSEYLSVSYYNISTNMSICVHTSGNIYIQDSSKSNMSATDFKNAMQGQYLFYETDTEVADITDTFDIEAGGTITSDSEVLPDVDFSMKCK